MGAFGSKSESQIRSVKEEIQEAPVVIYTTDYCNYCARAKSILGMEGVYFTERVSMIFIVFFKVETFIGFFEEKVSDIFRKYYSFSNMIKFR